MRLDPEDWIIAFLHLSTRVIALWDELILSPANEYAIFVEEIWRLLPDYNLR